MRITGCCFVKQTCVLVKPINLHVYIEYPCLLNLSCYFIQLNPRANLTLTNTGNPYLLEQVSFPACVDPSFGFNWCFIRRMPTITPQHTCPQTVKRCHNKAVAPKSINGFLVVAAARFLPGLRGVLSVWVPLRRPRWINMDENLIRTHSYFSLPLSLFPWHFIFPPLHRRSLFFYTFIIGLNESSDWSDELTRWHRSSYWTFTGRGTRRKMLAVDRNDCGSMSQTKKNGCMAPGASSYLWALKQVRNTIDVSLSWVFTHYRGHQRQREAKVIYMFYHSNDRTRAFSSSFNSLHFYFFLLYRDCACVHI